MLYLRAALPMLGLRGAELPGLEAVAKPVPQSAATVLLTSALPVRRRVSATA
jgi:hypothetical protein